MIKNINKINKVCDKKQDLPEAEKFAKVSNDKLY
jgi:hypothetical protein|tara:strand:- start:705 stop:806 length:102 start_codon:yes stop_codon:yes gene_type:complete